MDTRTTDPAIPPLMPSEFSPECRLCGRLAEHLDRVRVAYPGYYSKPVAPFGDRDPRLLIVGLAPGMHGANRTGRPFTGDHAGTLLYRTLHRYGFASRAESVSRKDGLRLMGCRLTNAVQCLPPENKPTGAEIRQCNRYLANELERLRKGCAVLALGSIAHQAVLLALGLKLKDFPFAHGRVHGLPGGLTLHDSYHCSRYNTQTKRLSPEMFDAVIHRIRDQLGAPASS